MIHPTVPNALITRYGWYARWLRTTRRLPSSCSGMAWLAACGNLPRTPPITFRRCCGRSAKASPSQLAARVWRRAGLMINRWWKVCNGDLGRPGRLDGGSGEGAGFLASAIFLGEKRKGSRYTSDSNSGNPSGCSGSPGWTLAVVTSATPATITTVPANM